MRRIAASLLVATVLGLLALPAVAHADVAAPAGPAAVAQEDDGTPSIIPDPDDEGTSNLGGLVVVVVLFGAWLAVGAVLLVRARRRSAEGRTEPASRR